MTLILQKNRKFLRKISKKPRFISGKINIGSVVYFSGDLGIWDMWDIQSLGPKNQFLSFEPRYTSAEFCTKFIFIHPIQIWQN